MPGSFRAGVVPLLFLAGLAGSAVHCAPMCGAFVLGQVGDRLAALPAGRLCERQRIRSGLLLPYHIGRIATYALLGAAAGGLGAALGVVAPAERWLLAAAALLFLMQAARRWRPGLLAGLNLPGTPALLRRVPHACRSRGLLLGLLLGFLPCGFVYAALTAAAATGGAVTGAAALAAFGLGTTPILMAIGIAGVAAERRMRRTFAAAAPIILAANAALLAALAVVS